MTPAIWTAIHVEYSLLEAIRLLSDCGWRAFEISTEHLEAIEIDDDAVRSIDATMGFMEQAGVTAPQSHAHLHANVAAADAETRENDIRRILRHIDISSSLGVRAVAVHPGGRGESGAESLNRVRRLNVDAFRRLGDHAGERGMVIGIENMMGSGASSPSELLELLSDIDHAAMGITIDTSHANVQELDIAAMIRDLGPHLVATHISDNDGSGDQHLTPGGGGIDWRPVMGAFGRTGYEGIFNLEIPGERHPDQALQRMKIRHAFAVADWLVGLAGAPTRRTS